MGCITNILSRSSEVSFGEAHSNMELSGLYFIRVEVKDPGNYLLPADVDGAFVNCVVPAPSKRDALRKLKRMCHEYRLTLVDVDLCCALKQVNWGSKKWERRFMRHACKARTKNEVVWDTFHAYPRTGRNSRRA